MDRQQFRVLYHEFLFRMVDLEVLSVQGDIKQLLGQFGGLLVFFSAMVTLGAMFFDPRHRSPAAAMATIWGVQHFLIATTMLVMGLFAVLSWDSTFPDRRDVLVLAPLPIRPRTIFSAKAAALGAALGLTVAALNGLPALTWGLFLFPPDGSGLLGPFRAVAAYWLSALAGGAFVFFSVLTVQGLAGQLPRRWYLRLSAVLQIAVFCVLLCTYFLEPSLSSAEAFAAPANQHALAWLPSYWYLGLLEWLNGSASRPGVAVAASRAVGGLVVMGLAASVTYLLAYLRTLRKIVEEPDIVPVARGGTWLPRFGNPLDTAVVQFSIRTLLRSRQHRIILAFYLGIGFGILALLAELVAQEEKRTHMTTALHQPSIPLLLASVVMLAAWVMGTRAIFGLPIELRANWIFRMVELGGAPACLRAGRRALLMLSVVPLCAGATAIYLCLWGWRPVLEHMAVLALLGAVVTELCLQNFQKIPFTCSYLPGKSRIHMAIVGVWPLIVLIGPGVYWEWRSLREPMLYAEIVAALLALALAARWSSARLARSGEGGVHFEEEFPPVLQTLNLRFDPTEQPSGRAI